MTFFLPLYPLTFTSYLYLTFYNLSQERGGKKKPWLIMSENDKATTRSGNHPQDHGQEQLTKIAEQQNRIVKDVEETPVDNSLPTGSASQKTTTGEQEIGQQKTKKERPVDSRPIDNTDEATAHHEQHVHQQTQSIIPHQEIKNMNQQRLAYIESGEIRKSREPLSVSEQFEKFDQAEANGMASRVAPYYWRPIPPALRKLNGMDKYNLRPAWNSPPPSPIQR